MPRRLRKWVVTLAATACVATPLVATQLVGGTAGATSGVDTIQYVEQTGAAHTYVKYIPGDGSTPTSQSVTGGGGCATPTVSGPPLLAFSAQYYGHPVGGVPYTGTPSAAVVGAYNGRTGVCAVSPAWSIEQNESLFLGVGTNTLVAGRLFVEASLQIERQDKAKSGSLDKVTLIERNGTSVVGTQSFTIAGSSGTQLTADTGVIAAGFTSVEIRVTSTGNGCSPSISIVGPNSTFSFGRLAQTITFTNTPPASPVVGNTYTVTATASSGLPVTLSHDALSTSGCTLDPSTGIVTLSGPAGTCIIDANQGGSARYLPAPQAQQTVTSAKLPQTITFSSTPPTDPIVGDTYNPAATATSGLPVTFSIDPGSTSGCTYNAESGVVTFGAPAGSCEIDANQAGNGSYLAAPQAQQSITVSQTICGQQTITAQSTDGTATSGEINAAITFQDYNGEPAPPSVCKSYQSFTATVNDPIPSIGGNQTITFDSVPLATAHLTASFTWAYDGFCTPDGNGGPICPVTYVSLDHGATWVPQTYCTSAQAAGLQWCTTSRSYAYVTQGTQITETWDGYGDPIFHHA